MRKFCFRLCLAVAFSGIAFGQQAGIVYLERPLTNEEVIALLQAGISREVIIARIQNSPSNFDTTPKGLKVLQEAGAGDRVLLAILQIRHPGMKAVDLKSQLPVQNIPAEAGAVATTKGSPEKKDGQVAPAGSLPKQEVKYLGTTQVEKPSGIRKKTSQPRSRSVGYPKKK